MKHTELPWRIKEGFSSIVGPNNKWVAAVQPEELFNAEFIVRACNSHYELLEAVQMTLDALNAQVPYSSVLKETLKKAIAKADGKGD